MDQSQDWRTWDWGRIAEYFVAARGRRPQQVVADAIGVSVDTIQNLEGARRPKGRKPQSAEPLATYYGWKPGSLRLIGLGGEPELYEVPVASPKRAISRAERDALVAEALADRTLRNGERLARLEALWAWPLAETGGSDG